MSSTEPNAPLHLLLLGGSGFVGKALLREIDAMPAGSIRVRALLRNPASIEDRPYLDKVQGSLESLPADLEPASPYVLVHFAVKHIDTDGTGFHRINVDATSALLASLGPRFLGVLYGSSMSVYGRGEQDGVSEAEAPNADTPLSESRRLAEERIADFARARGISALLLRPRFVVGEGDRFVLPNLAKLLRKRIGIASGAQRFSVIDVADYARVLVRLARLVAEQKAQGAPVQEALNIGLARPVSFAEIAGVLGDTLGIPDPRLRLPVSTRVTQLLRRLPIRALDQIATRLELVGLSHWGDTRSLAARIGDDIVQKDPITAVRQAAAGLRTSLS